MVYINNSIVFSHENGGNRAVVAKRGWGEGEMERLRTKGTTTLLVLRRISSEDLMHSMMAIVKIHHCILERC